MRSKKISELAIHSEHMEQCAFIQWFRLQYPKHANQLFAIPNGGLRNIKVAQKLKAEGVMAGVADLFFMEAQGGYHGLFIEMKKEKGGSQTASQKEFENIAIESGFLYVVSHGNMEAQRVIKKYIGGEFVRNE